MSKLYFVSYKQYMLYVLTTSQQYLVLIINKIDSA